MHSPSPTQGLRRYWEFTRPSFGGDSALLSQWAEVMEPWVEVTVGTWSNGQPQPPDFNEQSTGEGAIALGFYNSLVGDGSYFTQLAISMR